MSSKGEYEKQKMKDLKQQIQFDDPACLLFTSVRPNRFQMYITCLALCLVCFGFAFNLTFTFSTFSRHLF